MTVCCEAGSLARLTDTVIEASPRSIALFTGGRSYEASGAKEGVERALSGHNVDVYGGILENPTLDAIENILDGFRDTSPDLLIAVGGGSVIDTAKVVGAIGPDGDPRAVITGEAAPVAGPPLVAIPTTAGTGSEATHFAVTYVEGRKYSVADPSLRPEHVILDPELTYSLPPDLTAVTGLDALSQAMESLWSTRSTDASRTLAAESLQASVRHLVAAVTDPTPEMRGAMCLAAHTAGRAIDVSFTTAAHALSYTLTARHGVSHGLAVALSLGPLLVFNAGVTEADCTEARGVAHVQAQIEVILEILGAADAAEGRARVEQLIRDVGLPDRLSEVGAGSDVGRRQLVAGVNVERLTNNPRRMTEETLTELVAAIP